MFNTMLRQRFFSVCFRIQNRIYGQLKFVPGSVRLGKRNKMPYNVGSGQREGKNGNFIEQMWTEKVWAH
jgi:hypothetical protein